MRPSGVSCSTNGGGTSGPPAATRMASYGAYALQPRVPSPTSIETLIAAARSAACADFANAGTRSIVNTGPASAARSAV